MSSTFLSENSLELSEFIRAHAIEEDEIIVSFDVETLYTNVPIDGALAIIGKYSDALKYENPFQIQRHFLVLRLIMTLHEVLIFNSIVACFLFLGKWLEAMKFYVNTLQTFSFGNTFIHKEVLITF